MEEIDIIREIGDSFTFHKRPSSLPADLRPDWRIVVVLLMLKICCISGKSSLRRLHVLNWAVRSKESRRAFIDFMNDTGNPDTPIVRFDPALHRAIDYAAAENLVTVTDGQRIQITEAGGKVIESVENVSDILVEERRFFEQLGKKITEKKIKDLLQPGY